jgi:hypothetical protein
MIAMRTSLFGLLVCVSFAARANADIQQQELRMLNELSTAVQQLDGQRLKEQRRCIDSFHEKFGKTPDAAKFAACESQMSKHHEERECKLYKSFIERSQREFGRVSGDPLPTHCKKY